MRPIHNHLNSWA